MGGGRPRLRPARAALAGGAGGRVPPGGGRPGAARGGRGRVARVPRRGRRHRPAPPHRVPPGLPHLPRARVRRLQPLLLPSARGVAVARPPSGGAERGGGDGAPDGPGRAVSGYQAACPSCGATVVFSLGASRLKVCEHCGTAVARKGTSVADYGKVADLIPTPSVLALGMEGRYEGAPAFRLVGRLQLDWGHGTWD